MLKHCRPDILARGHLSLLHRVSFGFWPYLYHPDTQCEAWGIWYDVALRESHAVILQDRVVPASQVPFPGEPSGEPGNGTWRAGTTLYRRNDSVGFFFSPVTIKLLQKIEQKRVLIRFAFVLFEFIVCYDRRRACATNYWPITDVISKPKVKVVEHDRDRFIPCLMWSDIFSLSHYKIKEIARVRNTGPWLKKQRLDMKETGI